MVLKILARGCFRGNGNFGHGGNFSVVIALLAAMLVTNLTAIVDLVRMQVVLEMMEATMTLTVTTINLQILDP